MRENLESLLGNPILLIALGLFFGGYALRLVKQHLQIRQAAVRSKTWPATEGRVINATLIKIPGLYAGWRPRLTYVYRANSVEYTGHRIAFDYFNRYTHLEAELIMRRYPVSAPIPVYYDPDHPQESTLEQTPHGLIAGLLALFFSLIVPTGLWGIFTLAGLSGLAAISKK